VISALHKKLFRTFIEQWGQSLAVIMVIASGTANFICLNSAHSDLSLTRDTYYQKYRLADFEMIVERAPESTAFKLEEIPGVRQVRGRVIGEAKVDIEGVEEPRAGRIVSMPASPGAVLNDIALREGRYFDEGAEDQTIVSERFAKANNLQLGDRIDITVKSRRYSLRIVGLALAPEFVYMIRNVQELIPSPERFGVLWVPEDFAQSAMDLRTSFNSFLGTVDDPDRVDAVVDQADKALKPFGVHAKVKRSDMISNRFLTDELHGLSVSARIVPAIFMTIAATILLVLLNRMVRTERTQVGLMKAYGYSDLAVATHYIQYALLLTLGGCILGFFGGQWLARGLIGLYVQFYAFPLLESRVYPDVVARSMALAAGAALVGAISAALQAAQIQPAEAMRPEAPKVAHQVWLERIPALWRRVSFLWKMIFRNIARNRVRAGLNSFGVSVATGLLIMGFFTMDALHFGLSFQFQRAQREDVRVSFITERGTEALHSIAQMPHVRRAEAMLQYPFELKTAWRKKEVVVVGLEDDSELQPLLNFALQRVPVEGEGLIITQHMANQLGLKVGDFVTLKPLMGKVTREFQVPISRTTEQFLGNSGYMRIETLSRMLGEETVLNAALLRIAPEGEDYLKKTLKDVPGVAAVNFTKDSYRSLLDTIGANMQVQNTMVLFFAGIIACSVIYNITAVALAERQRELASLRVLGLSPQEVGRILYNENIVLSLIGVMMGWPLGTAICKLIVHAYSNDLFRLPFYIEPRTYAMSSLLSLFFVFLANLMVRRRILRLDLVEVLKERD